MNDLNMDTLLDKAKQSRRDYNMLKQFAQEMGDGELAYSLEQAESDIFPTTLDDAAIIERVKELRMACNLAGFFFQEKFIYIMDEIVRQIADKKGNFSTSDAVKIKCKAQELFG